MLLVGYEPFMESLDDNAVTIKTDWDSIVEFSEQLGLFDYVTCFEVLEHFSPQNQYEALKKMHSVVKPTGTVIISVPIEKGFPSFI